MARIRPGSPAQLGLTIFLGYFSIAIAFGVAGRQLGFALIPIASFSVFVFAGASQFLAIGLLAQGIGVLPVVFATFVLNARHIVMSMALRDRITGSKVPRPLLAFGITDEIFASAAIRPGSVRDTDLLVMEAMAYSGWVAGTVTGFGLGTILPPALEAAMGIALYAMFVALVVPGVIRFWRYGLITAAAGGLHIVLGQLELGRGPALLIAIVLPAVVFGFLPTWSEDIKAETPS